MPIKTIFLPLNDADGAAVSLGAALSLAKTSEAAVDVVHLRADPTESLGDFVGESVSPQLVEEVLTQAEKRSKDIAGKTRKAYDAAKAKADGIKTTYREEQGNADLAIETQGRISDLIIARRPRNARDAATWVTAEVSLMGTGRPVLVVPSKGATKIGSNVAICWNGSIEAAKALSVAMPFLVRAKTVTVISAHDGKPVDHKGVLAYLARQGVKAKGVNVKAGANTARALGSAAKRAGADLVVMGAYTHSRVREMLFGGVTEHALTGATLPVLLVH